jgi:hypothetical protein
VKLMVRYPAKGGRAMTVGRNPYRAPDDAPPMPGPASGMPPSRFPGLRSLAVGVVEVHRHSIAVRPVLLPDHRVSPCPLTTEGWPVKPHRQPGNNVEEIGASTPVAEVI